MAPDPANRPEWDFYGRDKELDELSGYLHIHPFRTRAPVFQCTAITGRRGVGKNALLDECMTVHDLPERLILFELPSNRPPADNKEWSFFDAECLERLHDHLHEHRLVKLLADMPAHKKIKKGPAGTICDIIEHLVYKGYIFALDEVHNCGEHSDLPSELKMMIDRLYRKKKGVLCATGKPPPTGHLILMGSHQQKFQKMRRGDQPLGGHRIHKTAHLRPWPMTTILNVAHEHGWDRRPRRLLTLLTAFGGLPSEWERFAELEEPHDHLAYGWPPLTGHYASDRREDQDWHRAFVAHAEHNLRNDADRRWDNAAFIQLPEEVAEILCVMGMDISTVKMQSLEEIHAKMDPELVLPRRQIWRVLKHFMDDLDVVGCQKMFTGPGSYKHRWYMKDNTTLFQMALAPDLFQSDWRASLDQQEPMPGLSESVANLEGHMLERWIKDLLAQHPGVIMNVCGAKPLDGKMGDIDGLVRLAPLSAKGKMSHDRKADRLLCINAKRQGDEHKIDKFQDIVDDFMDPACNPDKDVDAIRELRRLHLFVSPQFGPQDRERIHAAGHLAMDIPDLIHDMYDNWPVLNTALAKARRPVPRTPQTSPGTKPDGPQ